jgi:rhodanese-related sulfurtransferase
MRRVLFFFSPLLLLIACSCAHRVSSTQAHALVKDGARLVDVRSPEEFASEHLDGAINIPVGELENRLSELEPKDQAVVVYCHTGIRSARAASKLAAAGFTKVADLGGMSNWNEAP